MAMVAREQFLSRASVSLQSSNPGLAQELRVIRHSLQSGIHNTNHLDSERWCPACGGLEIDSQTVEVAKKTTMNAKAASSAPTQRQNLSLVIHKCRTCSRSKKVPVQQPKSKTNERPGGVSENVSADMTDVGKDRDPKIQKTSSRKRAKERKDREGLQALLSKRVDNSQASNTFDLMDFMSSRN